MRALALSADQAWLRTLKMITKHGEQVSPRGMATLEIPQHTISVDMRLPVITIKERQLSYRFMAAEAFWILTGDDTVAGIAPWNPRIAEFSDNGETFFGAYGPKIVAQLDYVVEKLMTDRDSRQAGLTIWRECPPQTKDVPCTIAAFANIRDDVLHVHVFMRSSDAWLGLPYDIFNFSMLGHLICAKLNVASGVEPVITPGNLYLTAASSHLYDRNKDDAERCLAASGGLYAGIAPERLYLNPEELLSSLAALRDTFAGDRLRWWETSK